MTQYTGDLHNEKWDLVMGRLIIVVILLLGIVLAGGSWWHRRAAMQRTMEYFGPQAAERVARAPQVEALRLVPEGGAAGVSQRVKLSVQGRVWAVTERVDISEARGLVHFRQALLEDRSFDDSRRPNVRDPDWDYAVRFTDATGGVTLVFSTRSLLLAVVDDETPRYFTGPMIRGLETYFQELFPLDGPSGGPGAEGSGSGGSEMQPDA